MRFRFKNGLTIGGAVQRHMTLCTPPCLHQDYCFYFGCPFEREPSVSEFCAGPLPLGQPSALISERSPAAPSRKDCIAVQGDRRGHLFEASDIA